MENKKTLSKKEVKDIRLRTMKILHAIKGDVKIPFNYKVVGSLQKGRIVTVDQNGKYDIDIDITIKGKNLVAQEVYGEFKRCISKHMRIDEKFSKQHRVIRIVKETTFYIDIAIVDEYNTPKRIIVNSGGKYAWRTKN